MQNDKIFSETISALVRTRSEANLLLEEIDILTKSLYKIGSGNLDAALESSIRAKTANAIKLFLGTEGHEEVFNRLRERVNNLEYINLTLGFEPTLETLGRISNWVRQNIKDDIALDLSIDKSILGGAKIEYKGRIFNSTLLSRVDEYFKTNDVNI